MPRTREPLHCVDGVCTPDNTCFFCGAGDADPCKFPGYASQIQKQVDNPRWTHRQVENGTMIEIDIVPEK